MLAVGLSNQPLSPCSYHSPSLITAKGVKTERVAGQSLSPQSAAAGRNPNAPFQIVGYRASNRITVTIRDITKVADTIDVLVGAGANEISGISFMARPVSP